MGKKNYLLMKLNKQVKFNTLVFMSKEINYQRVGFHPELTKTNRPRPLSMRCVLLALNRTSLFTQVVNYLYYLRMSIINTYAIFVHTFPIGTGSIIVSHLKMC